VPGVTITPPYIRYLLDQPLIHEVICYSLINHVDFWKHYDVGVRKDSGPGRGKLSVLDILDKMLLKAHELWEVIEEEKGASIGQPEKGKGTKSDAKWRRKDQLALSNIASAVKSSEQEHVYNCDAAKEV
jgi:hypothetical protein